jgi:hypothetical protein
MTQNAALKTKLDAAVREASILTKGLEDALAHSKTEIERLRVTFVSCIRFRASADHSVCFVCMVLGKCKRMVYTVCALLPSAVGRVPSADRRQSVRSGVARKAV